MATNMTKNFEEITKQVLDINRKYINKSIDFVGELKNANPDLRISNINQDLIADVFTGIIKLNLEYYSKLVDYGFSVSRQILGSHHAETNISSFTLSGTVQPGGTIEMGFVLDNSKDEAVLCQFVASPFVDTENHRENPDISVEFEPASLELKAGESADIKVRCTVSENSAIGKFCAEAKVIGFEPAYFTIVLSIEQNTAEKAHENQSTKDHSTKNRPN